MIFFIILFSDIYIYTYMQLIIRAVTPPPHFSHPQPLIPAPHPPLLPAQTDHVGEGLQEPRLNFLDPHVEL